SVRAELPAHPILWTRMGGDSLFSLPSRAGRSWEGSVCRLRAACRRPRSMSGRALGHPDDQDRCSQGASPVAGQPCERGKAIGTTWDDAYPNVFWASASFPLGWLSALAPCCLRLKFTS